MMWLLPVYLLFLRSAPSSARTLTFEEGRCDGPFTLTPQENLTITHVTSTPSSAFCQDIAFSGWDSINSIQREICVKQIKNQLHCSQTLIYRVSDYDASVSKFYGCKDTPGQIPVFCTFDTLYIRVNSAVLEKETSHVTYTVYSGREQGSKTIEYNSSSSASHVAIIIGVLGLFVAILVPVICIRLKKARDLQNQDQAVTYRRNQQPRIKEVHHYHQVDNHGNPDSLVGSKPVPGLYNRPRGYVTPTRSSPRSPGPPPSSSPIEYQFSPGQHIISPHTSLSAEQNTTVTCKPPFLERGFETEMTVLGV